MKNQRPKCTATKQATKMFRHLLCAVLLLGGGSAWAAQVIGVVTHLSGPLLDRKADGSVKVLGLKSEVENGDTLVSEKNTYAQIRFVDNHEITLKPGTTFRIENFHYDAARPDADSAAFSLVKGGLRSITGLLGKRNKERFSLKTPSATIGIRGTTFVATYVPPSEMRVSNGSSLGAVEVGKGPQAATEQGKTFIDRSPLGNGTPAGNPGRMPAAGPAANDGAPFAVAQNLHGNLPQMDKPPSSGGAALSAQEQAALNALSSQAQAAMQQAVDQARASQTPQAPQVPAMQGLAPGLHLQVTDGAIVVTNNGGSLGFQAGQFGYVPSVNQPPVIVPPNTGLQFAPPPSFSGSGSGPQASSGGSSPDKPAVDCIVR
jgi:hypothetical protein